MGIRTGRSREAKAKVSLAREQPVNQWFSRLGPDPPTKGLCGAGADLDFTPCRLASTRIKSCSAAPVKERLTGSLTGSQEH